MSSRLVLLSATLVLLLGPTVVYSQGFSQTWSEGFRGPTLLKDCTLDAYGQAGQVTSGDLTFSPDRGDFPANSVISGMFVENLKTQDKGLVKRASGGLGKSFVTFNVKSIIGHGVMFQFKLYGTVPPGVKFPKVKPTQCNAM